MIVRINIRAQFVAGDAGNALNRQHALHRYMPPLRYGLSIDPELSGHFGRPASGLNNVLNGNHSVNSKLHLQNRQACLSNAGDRFTYTFEVDQFARRFRQARDAAKLKQENIAAACLDSKGEPISRSAVAQWERLENPTRPSLEYLAIAAKLMNVSVDYLIGLSNDPKGSVGLSEDALQIARIWDTLPSSVKDDVLHALHWSITQKGKQRTDALGAILEMAKGMKK